MAIERWRGRELSWNSYSRNCIWDRQNYSLTLQNKIMAANLCKVKILS